MTEWREIEEFPDYEVSALGQIRNAHSLHLNGLYNNGSDVLQVNMRRHGRAYNRSVQRLVADAFLDPCPQGGQFVPWHVDRDWRNCAADNLEWKPRWWAMRIARQDKQEEPRNWRAVRVVKTGVEYDNALECARAIGGLEDLVLLTAQHGGNRSYMGSAIEFVW